MSNVFNDLYEYSVILCSQIIVDHQIPSLIAGITLLEVAQIVLKVMVNYGVTVNAVGMMRNRCALDTVREDGSESFIQKMHKLYIFSIVYKNS